jgi:D-alanyl-lipoteichoic acid acyltransferase DltB (MBOAT superfamily)
MFTSIEILAAVYGYGLEIYLDFSGYTDIALASAMLLGFRLPENFRRPYVSGSVSEFWTRWHISLGSWLRDYLYIGLGGNRKRVYLNILITMLLCGLWHGASITFVLWGAYHGIIMIIERITGFRDKVFKQGFMRVIKTALCFHLVLIGWVLFRSESLEKGGEIINGLIGLRLGALNLGYGIVVIIVIGYLLHFSPLKWKDNLMDKWNALSPEIHGFMSAVVTITVYYFSSVDVRPFIYFQF